MHRRIGFDGVGGAQEGLGGSEPEVVVGGLEEFAEDGEASSNELLEVVI